MLAAALVSAIKTIPDVQKILIRNADAVVAKGNQRMAGLAPR